MKQLQEYLRNPHVLTMLVAAFVLGAAVNAYAEGELVGGATAEGVDLLAETAPEAEVEDGEPGFFGRLTRGACEGMTGAQYGDELDKRATALDEREAALDNRVVELDRVERDMAQRGASLESAGLAFTSLSNGINAALAKISDTLHPAPAPADVPADVAD